MVQMAELEAASVAAREEAGEASMAELDQRGQETREAVGLLAKQQADTRTGAVETQSLAS